MNDRLAPAWRKWLVAVTTVIAVTGIAFIIARTFVNDDRCAHALGNGATFYGQDQCSPPPARVNGLL